MEKKNKTQNSSHSVGEFCFGFVFLLLSFLHLCLHLILLIGYISAFLLTKNYTVDNN